eukprot:6290211-Ditylum_brightwellii.AAC.1
MAMELEEITNSKKKTKQKVKPPKDSDNTKPQLSKMLMSSLPWIRSRNKRNSPKANANHSGNRELDDDDTSTSRQCMRSDSIDDEKEYKAMPTYAYPHRWMTKSEILYEQVKPSSHFYNLQQNQSEYPMEDNNEVVLGPTIGSIQMEILSCIGLSKKPKKEKQGDKKKKRKKKNKKIDTGVGVTVTVRMIL